ncbi:MAG: Gfo/Idh/MocA family oxidoreductase [Candidatus Latescibacterota bacterium]
MADQIVRVAIAGLGRSGYDIHARHLRQATDRYRIVAVADQLPERRKEAREELGARACRDWSQLIERPDGYDLLVNALPSPLHTLATIAALNAGKHVLCEKPMARNLEEFDRMVEAARRNRRILAPFQNNRPQPFFLKILEVIGSGVLGRIVYVRSQWGRFARRWDWQTLQENMGGSLYNTGPHAIDQALAIFGFDRTPKVFCRMDCNNPFGADAEDHCTVTLYDPRRRAPQIDIVISAYLAYPQGELYSIAGTCGGLSGGADRLTWRYFDPAQAPRQKVWRWSVKRRYPSEELPWVEECWTLQDERSATGYTVRSLPTGQEFIYANLYDAITRGARLEITPAQVRKQIAVLEECHRQNPLPCRNARRGARPRPGRRSTPADP